MLYNCERVTFSESIVKWRFRVAWPVAHLGALGKFLPKRELNWHMEFPGQKGNLVCLFPIMPFVHLYLNVKLSFLWKQVKALFSIMHGSFCAFFLVWWEWQLWACIPTHAYYSWLLWLEYEITPPRLVFWILGFVIAGGTTLRHDGNICQGNPVEEAGLWEQVPGVCYPCPLLVLFCFPAYYHWVCLALPWQNECPEVKRSTSCFFHQVVMPGFWFECEVVPTDSRV